VYRRFYKRFMIKDGGALPVTARAQGDMACTRALHDGLRPGHKLTWGHIDFCMPALCARLHGIALQ